MANLSDAFGTISVEKVGVEFLEFLDTVQGTEEKAYYKLCEIEDFKGLVPDGDGEIEIEFSTMGRWNYGSNLEGYLNGQWMQNDDNCREAWEKFTQALIAKNGSVNVEYSDCDPAMDWMGTGSASLFVQDGGYAFSEAFDEQPLDVVAYAKMNDMSEYEAMESLHGDEPAVAYDKYVEQCKEKGVEPKGPNDWYEQDFEWEA